MYPGMLYVWRDSFSVQRLGFRVSDLGFRVEGKGKEGGARDRFKSYTQVCFTCDMTRLGFRVEGLWFQV